MKRILAFIAIVAALTLSAVAGTAAPASAALTPGIQKNVDPGGGQITSFFYIARVYIYYNGYWHWLNCQYVVYTNGSVDLVRCW